MATPLNNNPGSDSNAMDEENIVIEDSENYNSQLTSNSNNAAQHSNHHHSSLAESNNVAISTTPPPQYSSNSRASTPLANSSLTANSTPFSSAPTTPIIYEAQVLASGATTPPLPSASAQQQQPILISTPPKTQQITNLLRSFTPSEKKFKKRSMRRSLFDYLGAGEFNPELQVVLQETYNSSLMSQTMENGPSIEVFVPLLSKVYYSSQKKSFKQVIFECFHGLHDIELCAEYINSVKWDDIVNAIENEIQFREKGTLTGKTLEEQSKEGNYNFQFGEQLPIQFENGTKERKVRLVLSELASLVYFASKKRMLFGFPHFESMLFGNQIYRDEINIIIAIALYQIHKPLFTPSDLVRAFSYIPNGDQFLISYICNHPQSVDEIIRFLINEYPTEPAAAQTQPARKILELLKSLCEISVTVARKIRTACLESHKLPHLSLFTTCYHIQDTVEFMNSIFNSSNEGQPICDYIQKNHESELVMWLRQEILQLIYIQLASTVSNPRFNVVQLSGLIRVCCGMTVLSNVCPLMSKENFDMLIAITQHSFCSTRLVKLIISLLLICMKQPDVGVVATETLKEIVSNLWASHRFIDTLLLLATYFHTQIYKKIVAFVKSTTLLPNIQINFDNLQNVSKLFIDEVIPVDVLAKEIIKIPPKKVKKGEEWYVLQCVYYMLQSKLFRRHNVDASPWVYQQLLHCTDDEPVPGTIPKIIIELVSNSAPHPNFSFQMELFSKADILKHFSASNTELTQHALMLFYVLTVNGSTIPEGFDADLIQNCDVMRIVSFLQADRERLGRLYSQLLALIVEQLQHLFHFDIILSTPVIFPSPSHVTLDNLTIEKVLRNPLDEQVKTKTTLEYLSTADSKLVLRYQDLVLAMIPKFLDAKDLELYVLKAFEQLWQIMWNSSPMALALKTVNTLHPSKTLEHEDIYKNILLLFGIDKRVFRVPSLFYIFLQVLGSFMVASRKFISNKSTNKQQKEVVNTMILTQDSTILQLLLEICLDEILFSAASKASTPTSKALATSSTVTTVATSTIKPPKTSEADLLLIRKQVCNFIHQRFIEAPLLAKLIHFQTYDTRLLPITTSLVDSIHICMDFLSELMNQPQVEKQVFGIQLASYLTEKYPLQRYIDIARTAVAKTRQFGTLGSGSTNTENRDSAMQCVPSLARIASAFPFLAIECIHAMNEIRTIFKKDVEMIAKIDQAFIVSTKAFVMQ